MKKILLLSSLVLLLTNCGNDTSEKSDDQSIDAMETNPIVASPDEQTEIIDEITFNDWLELGLLGEVSYLGVHSNQLDEYGEEMGMGGAGEGITFNKNGFITEESSWGCCGAELTRIEYKYNANNEITHRIFFSAFDDEALKTAMYNLKEKYFYNNGVLVKMKVAGSDSVLTEEHIFHFDKNDQLIKEEVLSEKDKSYVINYISKDNYKEVSFDYGDESENYKRTYELDENGRVIREKLYLSSGSIQDVKYTYTAIDERGNWTERTSKSRYINKDGEKENWKPYLIEERNIKYF